MHANTQHSGSTTARVSATLSLLLVVDALMLSDVWIVEQSPNPLDKAQSRPRLRSGYVAVSGAV
jgi:hypothetical protein